MTLSPEFTDLYLDLLWLEYKDNVDDAHAALSRGDRLGALAGAIQAYKAHARYMGALSCLRLGL